MRAPLFIQLHHDNDAAVRAELASGLQADAAFTHPKYLYDVLGSSLFHAITALPEYYLTRTEAGLLTQHAPAMAALLPKGMTLVDLGAGNCQKAGRLFDLLHPSRYVAVDISVGFLREALQMLQCQYPALDMVGLGMDFSSHLTLPPQAGEGPRLVFYPGSSIGNFTPAQAQLFMRQVRDMTHDGGLLIGVDLVKPRAFMERAYDDALGVTAAFNRNLLRHINHLLGSDFEVSHWRHRSGYNVEHTRIELYVEALQDVTVHWPGAQRHFMRGECIHTENSCKYTPEQFEAHLRAAGFTRIAQWRDPKDWFAMFLAQP